MERDQLCRMRVKADGIVRPLHNFWNNIHFHPTDAVEDDWGQRILDQAARDGAARYVRIYAMLEDVVDRDAEGRLRYDFCQTDKRLDYLTEKGFRLLICFNFLPRAIAADPQCMSWLARYKGKHINTSKPRDYREWQEVCRVYTGHLRERYGEERLAEWYFHCWNEPDFPDYFLSDAPRGGHGGSCDPETERRNMDLAAEEYTKLYDHFAKGVTEACGAVKIGGPSAALSDRFIEHFLRHVKEGTNWADGGKGARIDFLSIHTYGAFPKDLAAGKPVRVEDTYERMRALEVLARRCGFPGLEIVVDEWGLSTEGFTDTEKCPVLNFRNTEYYAAAYAHMIHYYVTHRAPVSLQMICLSGQHNLVKEFHGYRSFFTLHGFPKPIYNAYALCAKLGDRLLKGDGIGGDCLRREDRIEARFSGDNSEGRERAEWEEDDGSRMGMLPTADENGRIAVLLYRFSPSAVMEAETIRRRTSRHVRLEIEGIYGGYRIRHYRIDHGNANAYTAWCELGRRNELNQAQTEWIRGEGALKLWCPEEEIQLQGQWELDIVMTDNAVSLVELEPLPRQ